MRYLVTSALPYVNGIKHIGNVVGSLLPADAFTRFLRLKGEDVVFVCGTDEHGAPSEIAALKERKDVKKYCDEYHAVQKKVYEDWGFSFDYFGRTSAPTNHETTKQIFLKAFENGFISEKEMLTPFCEDDKRHLPDRFIEGTCPKCGFDGARGDQCEKCGAVLDPNQLIKPHCSICGKKNIVFKKSKHLFLDLPKLSDRLKKWIEASEQWPPNARNFALSWIKEGLKERCITRDLKWGVSVPLKGFEEKVFYVWFDAPIGYISFTKEWAEKKGEAKLWEDYWRNKDCRIIHFLGKDNIVFHTVIWPAMLMASEYAELPFQVKSFEFLNLEGKKFSTSRNWGIDSKEALEWFPADYWRYYLLSILPEHSDSDFVWTEFSQKVNNDLADVFGNLAHRCLSFTNTKFGGVIPAPKEFSSQDEAFVKAIFRHTQKTSELMEEYKIQEALREAMDLARGANKYFNDCEPWKKESENCIYLTANALHSLSIILSPFIPSSCDKLLGYLNAGKLGEKKWVQAKEFLVKPGTKISAKIEPLFKKIDSKQLEKPKRTVQERSK